MNFFNKPVVFVPLLALLGMVGFSSGWTYLMAVGSNPFTVTNVGTLDIQGRPKTDFSPGDIVVIKRKVCADRAISLEFFPSLRSAEGVFLSLQSGASSYGLGCRETLFGFPLPAKIVDGEYTYSNLIKYQTNWVGRDEMTVYPPLHFTVTSHE